MNIASNTPLPVPTDAVVIGRGRVIKQHPGNIRFMAIVRSHLPSYFGAPTKTQKSLLIKKIMKEVRSGVNADFVKLVDGVYRPIEETAARITVAQTIRDELNEHYKSSKQHKRQRRFQRKQASFLQARQSCPSLTSMADNHASIGTLGIQPLSRLGPRAVSEGSYKSSCSVNSILREALEEAQIYTCSPLVPTGTVGEPAIIKENYSPDSLVFPGEDNGDSKTAMGDTFSSLFKAFGKETVAQESPFEPCPLLEDSASFGSLEDDWEPLPLLP